MPPPRDQQDQPHILRSHKDGKPFSPHRGSAGCGAPYCTGTGTRQTAVLPPQPQQEPGRAPVAVSIHQVHQADWFSGRWADPGTVHVERLPQRRQVRRSVLASPGLAGRRLLSDARPAQATADRARALSRAEVEQLLSREGISLRERTFWRMAYEIAARSAELLALDVEDLDLPNRHAKVRRKGGAVDVIVWQTGTARLLPRLLRDRKSGPVFVTERKARVPLSAADLDEHGHAAQLPASRGAVLRGLRWRDPASAPALGSHSRCRGQHWSSHADGQERPHVRAVAGKYARVSAEALARHQLSLSAVCCLLSAVCC